MNDLIKIQNERLVVSSRQIAENFEKRHDNILRDIGNLAEDVPNFEEMFLEDEEPDSYGRSQRVYLMNRDGFSLLVMGFTGKQALAWKLKYIDAFNRMEQTINSPIHSYMIQDPIERAKAWINEQEEKSKLVQKVQELAPAKIFRDAVGTSDDGILVRDMAKVLKQNSIQIGEKRLREWLKEKGYMNANNMPSQRSMELKIMRIEEIPIVLPDRTILSKTTKITGKGQIYLIEKFIGVEVNGDF